MKTCTKCGETKSVMEFIKDASKRDGLLPRCKSCDSAIRAARHAANPDNRRTANAAWRAENLDKAKAANAKWAAANPEKIKAARAKRNAANPDKVKASAAKWYAANRERVSALRAVWHAANLEKVKASSDKYRAANPKKTNAACAKWAKANPEAIRIYSHNRRARKAGGKLSNGLAAKLFKLQRGKCACGCKQSLGDDYHMDHRMPLALGGANEDWNMQLLTATCNLKKGARHPVAFAQQQGLLI